MKLEFNTSDEIRSRIRNIGRTEDVKFSPDNKQFIIAEFLAHTLHLFTIRYGLSESPQQIHITNYCRITSEDIRHPHGVTFMGNSRLVVCNRSGGVGIFKLPECTNEINEFNITAEESISGTGFRGSYVESPGSVDLYQIEENRYRLFICNNYRHTITSHLVEFGDSVNIKNEGIAIENSLQIPDGISISPDSRWIAVSNHVDGRALLFRNIPELNKNTPPSVSLEGPVCPHGIRFSPDGKKLYVADAASQYLFIYESDDGEWSGPQYTPGIVKIIDDEPFYLGNYGSKEGGIKGIDIDPSNSILVSTHKEEVISFYDLKALDELNHDIDERELEEYRRLRDESFNMKNGKKVFINPIPGLKAFQFIKNSKYLRPDKYKTKITNEFTMRYLAFKNQASGEALVDPSGPVISLTSHGKRIETVFCTIESIRQGIQKPSRMILWLDEEDKNVTIPGTLQRLRESGLEIYYSENIGPHKKYYSYIRENEEFATPLVTADDDVIYPSSWLKNLVKAYHSDPSVIHCYRAYRMSLRNGKFTPFNDWKPCESNTPSHLHFITGTYGVLYPPDFLAHLKNAGDGFQSMCPMADDVWLTVNALRAGFKVVQLPGKPGMFKTIPGSQQNGLFYTNVYGGGSHQQLVKTFTKEEMSKLDVSINEEVTEQ